MSVEFVLPDIGEGIVECEIVEWLVEEGQLIEEDQPVVDVSTDKALVQIPSKYSGRVIKLHYAQGDIAKVHSPLFAIEPTGEAAAAPIVTTPERAPTAAPEPEPSEPATGGQTVDSHKVLATPAVRRIARENNLNLALVPGTGKNGRILKEDIQRYLSAEEAPAPALATAGVLPVEDRIEPIKGIRALMAKAMVESVSTIPHFTYVDEVDVTDLIVLRLQLKSKLAEQGIKLTLMPLFMKALSLAMLEFPIINSRANEDFTELHYLADHNIGMAVDSKAGLLVPNAKRVQTLSIVELAQELNRLTEAAREGRVAPGDMSGGTVTISNVGAIGGTAATPIINKPEVAIVALGKVQSLPRFDDGGQVVKRHVMTFSWSADHRVIDGGTIARFSNRWKEYLEDPSAMLLALR